MISALRKSMLILLLLTTSTAIAHAADETKPESESSWQVVYINTTRVGYSLTTMKTVERNGKELIIMESETHMVLKRFGQEIVFIQTLKTTETKDGDWLSFESEMRNPPASSSRTVGIVDGDKLKLSETINGETNNKVLDWNPEFKALAYQDRMLQDPPIKPNEVRKFKTFDTQFRRPTDVTITAGKEESIKLLDGKKASALKLTFIQSILPKMAVNAYIDDKGNTLKTVTPFLGTNLTTYSVPKEVALEKLAGGELDLAVSTLISVSRIENAHARKKVVYRVTTPDEDATEHIVVGDTQAVRKISDNVAEVTVTSINPDTSAAQTKADAEFTSPSTFLQSNDPAVIEHAEKASGDENNPSKVALKMEKYVRDVIKEKNFSTAMASAAEVAKQLEGDCTEHACLLAAMLRVKKIPSRVAVGMVYVDRISKFGGHMWTEAYLGGKWIPLDATLGKGGIGAGHIKLAQSSFSDDEPSPLTTFMPLITVLGKMKIDVVSIE